jgi:hypothetical protein
MKSIIQNEKKCWVCGKTRYLEEHHCMGGNPNRKNSEKYGLKIWLCLEHHRGQTGVHNDQTLCDFVHQVAQQAFEKEHSREEFMTIFGRNYLE